MATYRPSVTPISFEGLRAWLGRQLRDVADVLIQPTVVMVHFDVQNAEPAKYSNGDVVYADGSNWNPGSGGGLYLRHGGAWVKL